MPISDDLLNCFRRDLDAVAATDARLGLAVSGGPDSLALLALAANARPGLVEAASVDHRLRPEAADEAAMVAGICERLGVPHQILTVEWPDEPPKTALQARARTQRYRLLGEWAKTRGLAAIVTAHHLDDQAETFMMRLSRGVGVRGLAGMRPVSPAPGSQLRLIRPLLGWRRSELQAVCSEADLQAVEDPSNADTQFERVRMRQALAAADWLDASAVARSASHLASADAALSWATAQVWDRAVTVEPNAIAFDPSGFPQEIRWRLARRAVRQLATEARGADLRGRELDRLLQLLASGRRATLRGVLCSGGKIWRFIPAPNRTLRGPNSR